MSNELNKDTVEVTEEATLPAEKKSKKNAPKKENFFKRIWKKFVKLCKDTVGEMKKVVWTPKAELSKNTKLVIVTVIAFSLVIAIIDLACSYLINGVAGLIG
ncbi:MAG: preprotein translocase subunit SecE [Clostridia bacterium]|nr:preprotein translocase subunit SecE [Clostridia bacterium]